MHSECAESGKIYRQIKSPIAIRVRYPNDKLNGDAPNVVARYSDARVEGRSVKDANTKVACSAIMQAKK
jgi:hypothetical protein